jgi:thiopeptide-type bacteriocin biosynthesis protein
MAIRHGLDRVAKSTLSKITGNIIKFEQQINDILHFKDTGKCSLYLNMERKCRKGGPDLSWQSKILDGMYVLGKIVPAYENENLCRFKDRFGEKFNLRWTPLLAVIDPEIGIGYHSVSKPIGDSSLIKDIQIEYPCDAAQQVQWSLIHSILLNKWRTLGQTKSAVPTIQIEDDDLEAVHEPPASTNMPPSISVLFRTIDDLVYIEEAGGSSANALIGRFTAFNADIKSASEELSEIEAAANPEVVFAEIAYCPNPSVANVNRRANIRKYEIPILTGSDLPEERQIHLNDLWVSVVDGEIILWSKKLGKRVIPRLSSAFNYLSNNFPIFRFLCDLQYQGIQPSYTLDLSDIFPGLTFYPRVCYKNTVLHLASWHLHKDRFDDIFSNADVEDQLRMLKKMVVTMHWPKFISVHHADNYIVINTSNDQELEFLLHLAKRDDTIAIKEFPFWNEKEAKETYNTKSYATQYIALLYHDQKIYHNIIPEFNKIVSVKPIDRNFLPGSQWTYFKIYCHSSRANELLVDNIMPLCDRWIASGFLRQWFFVRYGDPDYHLRVRLNADPVNTGLLIKGLSKSLTSFVTAGLVSNFMTAVYEREIERYGADIIEELEDSFCSSTNLICRFLTQTAGKSNNENQLFEFAYASITILLNSFKYGLKDKIRLFDEFYHYMQMEFQYSDKTKDQFKRKFRTIREADIFLPEQEILRKYKVLLEANHFQYTHERLNCLTSNWPLNRRNALLGDIIHLHLNRIFSSATRKNELVVYYCLWRHFLSEQGRKNKNSLKSLTDNEFRINNG